MDKRIGAQLYTLRDFIQTKEDFDKSMERIKNIGYKAVQISAIGPIPAEDIKEICDKHGLVITCTHRGFDEYVNDLDGIIKFHKTLDCKIAGLGAMPGQYRDKIPEFVELMNDVTQKLAAQGISFAYHNHHFEFEKMTDGKFIMDYMLDNGKFDFILDVYWLSFAGINPPDYIRKVGKRAIVVHFKDLAILDNEVVMAEVGQGNLDWDSIIKASEEVGSLWAQVEQDVCRRDPFESMEISYNYLIKKGFC